MKLEHKTSMKTTLKESTIKNGIEVDKKKFKGIQNGEIKALSRGIIIGKHDDGRCYKLMITGYEWFGEQVVVTKKKFDI